MKPEKLLEAIIEVQDVAVELDCRCGNKFDQMLVERLHKVVKRLSKEYAKLTEE